MELGDYRLIISDFDGTLLRSDGTIGARTVGAIARYTALGGVFAICTGRMLTSILPEARKLSLKGLVAAYQGSVIADIESGALVRSVGFDQPSALKVCLIMEEEGLNIHLYTLDDLFVNYDNSYLTYYENVCHVRSRRAAGKLSDMIRKGAVSAVKFVAMVDKKDGGNTFRRLSDLLGGEFYVTTSADILVEITPKTHTKAAAVTFLADHYGVPLSRVIALGDNLNDAPMLRAAGKGIAVGNARDELKRAADEVTCTNDEDAVGKTIEKYGFRGGKE